MYHALNIIEAANTHKADVYQAAFVYFTLVDRLELHWFRDRINDYPITDRWSILAKAAFRSDLDSIQQALTENVIGFDISTKKSITQRLNLWMSRFPDLMTRWQAILSDLRNEDQVNLPIVSVGVRELFELVRAAQARDQGSVIRDQ